MKPNTSAATTFRTTPTTRPSTANRSPRTNGSRSSRATCSRSQSSPSASLPAKFMPRVGPTRATSPTSNSRQNSESNKKSDGGCTAHRILLFAQNHPQLFHHLRILQRRHIPRRLTHIHRPRHTPHDLGITRPRQIIHKINRLGEQRLAQIKFEQLT